MMPRVKRIAPEETAILTAVGELEMQIFSDAWSLRSIQDAVESPCMTLYAALSETDELMGYLFFMQVLDEAEVANIAVSPDFRRNGVASCLLDTALENVEADIFLEVRASNAPAIALYEKYGFRQYGVRRNYYESPREDALLMQRHKEGNTR